MKWIYSSVDDAINLDNIAHIWIEKSPNGFCLMGEMIHNQEEVCLSPIFPDENRCRSIFYDLFKCVNNEKKSDFKVFEDAPTPHWDEFKKALLIYIEELKDN